jgi:hypothetical protein
MGCGVIEKSELKSRPRKISHSVPEPAWYCTTYYGVTAYGVVCTHHHHHAITCDPVSLALYT